MAISVAAYALPNRSSDITADVVARIGFVPDRVEKKMTVGQQRRGKRKKQTGRGGSSKVWQKLYKAGGLRGYALLKQLNPKSTATTAVANLLSKAPADSVSPEDMYNQYLAGLLGDDVDAVFKKLPGGQTYAVEKEDWFSGFETQPVQAPQPEADITYGQTPTNPAEDEPVADVSQTEASTVNETALVRQATSSILEQSGLNSLDEIDSAEDVELLQESIEEVSAKAPEGVAAGLWGVFTTAAGLNLMKTVQSKSGTPMPARVAAEVEVEYITEPQALGIAADHVASVNQSISSFESSQSSQQVPATPSQGDSSVDITTAAYTPASAAPSFAESPVQQADMTSAIIDAVNESQDARDMALLEPLEQTTNLIAGTNQLLNTLNTQQLAAITALGPELQTKLVTDRQLDKNEVPKVLDVLKNDPDIAELLRQGLVQPEQLKDSAYVASLRMNLLKNKSEGRPANLRGRVRASKAPVFKRQVPSRRTPGLQYFKPARHAAPSIFAQ